jgi:hypothetical protein
MATGPSAQQATAVAVTTSEAIVATIPPSNWAGSAGALITVSANYSPTATGVAIVFRVRQGNLITGTLVGVARTVTVVSPSVFEISFSLLDSSAFGQNQQGGQYVLTAQGTTAGGTLNILSVGLETTAPVQ